MQSFSSMFFVFREEAMHTITPHNAPRLPYSSTSHGNACMFLFSLVGLKADFQSSHEAPRSSLRVHAWALSSNHNAKQLILIRCKHSQRAARSFVRGLEIRLYSIQKASNWSGCNYQKNTIEDLLCFSCSCRFLIIGTCTGRSSL